MNGRGAVDHGVVMVKHQAGIFHACLLRVGDEHSIEKKRPLVKRALSGGYSKSDVGYFENRSFLGSNFFQGLCGFAR